MTIFKVAYMPEFSKEFLACVRNYCNSSMISPDSDTEQYEISQIVETFQEEEIGIFGKDLELFKVLQEQEVNYIEIKMKY